MVKLVRKETMLVARAGLLIYLILFAFSCRLGKNETIIKGKVIDSSNSPIENATLLLKKKDSLEYPEHYVYGTISDKNGEFEMKINGNVDDFALYIGKIGYDELFVRDIKLVLENPKLTLIQDSSKHIDYIPKN